MIRWLLNYGLTLGTGLLAMGAAHCADEWAFEHHVLNYGHDLAGLAATLALLTLPASLVGLNR